MKTDELLARECIRHTMGKYSIAGDDYDVEEYLTCFADDAILEFDNFPGLGPVRREGLDAIREFVAGFFTSARQAEADGTGGGHRHHLTTCRIDLTGPDTASARTYCLAFNRSGFESSGYYTDRFRKVGDDWLIVHRRWSDEQ